MGFVEFDRPVLAFKVVGGDVSTKGPGSVIVDFLQAEFEKRKEKNARYSKRAFAQLLEIDSSTLSQILNGKRALTFAVASKLLSQLGIDEHEKNKLLLTFEDPGAYASTEADVRELTEKEMRAVSAWQFYAIICALEIPGIDSPSVIAEKIGCPLSLVNSSIEVLLDLGMIQNEEGKLRFCGYVAGFKLSPAARKMAHRSAIGRALYALERFESESDFSGSTVTIEKEKLPEAMRRIEEFLISFTNYVSSGKKEDVYSINIQFFPLK